MAEEKTEQELVAEMPSGEVSDTEEIPSQEPVARTGEDEGED